MMVQHTEEGITVWIASAGRVWSEAKVGVRVVTIRGLCVDEVAATTASNKIATCAASIRAIGGAPASDIVPGILRR